MAGYGGLGGLGGFSYPTRRGAGAEPSSSVVQSDPEWAKSWEDKLASIPKTIAGEGTDLVFGGANYDANAAAPYRAAATNTLNNMFLSGYSGQNLSADQQAGLQAALSAAQGFGIAPVFGQQDNGATMGFSVNPYTDAGGAWASQNGMSHQVFDSGQAATVANPAYQKALADYEAAKVQRPENQIRQQQAYDTQMMGNGAVGGVMPSGYTGANFGQVTGQKTGGLGGLGGTDLTAVDQSQQTGAYMGGSGSYNPNPFAAGSYKSQNPWGGF